MFAHMFGENQFSLRGLLILGCHICRMTTPIFNSQGHRRRSAKETPVEA
jgi:hypothetical protein